MAKRGFETVVTGIEPLVQRLAQYPTQAIAAIGRGLKSAALLLVRQVQDTIYLGHAEGHLNRGPAGYLRRSVTWRVEGDTAEVGTNAVYGPIQEYGGEIKPKNANLLAIPIGNMKGSPRGHPDLFFVHTGGSRMYLMDKAGKPQYSLRPKVTIPARPYFGPAIKARGKDASEEVVKALGEVLKP